MSVVSDTTNVVEGLAIAIGIYLIVKAVQQGSAAVNNALNLGGVGATVVGTASWVGTTTPLTPGQADALAKNIGVDAHGGGWQLSPDGTQIWFFDGSYFDNKTGHFFSPTGQDLGDLLGNPGTAAPAPAPAGSFLDSVDVLSLGGA